MCSITIKMKQFEYTLLEVPHKGFWGYAVDHEALTLKLNELGRKGWEVALINDMYKSSGTAKAVIILKRELNH